MNESNPYAAPGADAISTNASRVRVAGEFLIGRSPMVLPTGVCVACGAEGKNGSVVKQDLIYVPFWMSAILLGSCVLYVVFPLALIAYLILRKRLKLNYWMCRECRSRRRWKIAATLALGTLAIVICVVARIEWLWLLGLPTLLICVYLAANWSHSPMKLGREGEEFVLKKLPVEYLDRVDARLEMHDEALHGG